MKDLKQLALYIAMSVAVIITLVKMSQSDAVPSGVVVSTAVLFVVVLPVLVAVRIAKKERERQ